jgi:mannose-6-phosphate isomerase-like protein (cupin superfamily)
MRLALILLSLAVIGCGSAQPPARGRVITTLPDAVDPLWTEAELAKPIAVRRLRATTETSISLIRLAGAEQPHIHKDHDLVVVLLAGQARVHLGDHVVEVHPGDVMEIPRGTVHWAENTGASASEVYAVFSPPYDGRDNLPVPPVPLPPP